MDAINDAYKIYNKNNLDEDKLRDIEKAYQTLSNYHSRRKYDSQFEDNNIVKDITASNENTGNEFFLNKDHEELNQISNFSSTDSSNLYSNRNFSDSFDNQMINLNRRLEQIEKKLDTGNKTNFYREKKTIKDTLKDGKKIITIEYIRNDNGFRTKSTKVIEYDKDGGKKTYFLKNNKYRKKYKSQY